MDNTSYLLGILDGEGTVCSLASRNPTSGKRYRSVRVAVQIGSKEVCLGLQKEWGGHVSEPSRPSRPHHRKIWSWELNGKAAIPLLEYMAINSRLKRQQAILGLEMLETFSDRSSNKWGAKGMPVEVTEKRERIAMKISALNRNKPVPDE